MYFKEDMPIVAIGDYSGGLGRIKHHSFLDKDHCPYLKEAYVFQGS
jgi:hypothetical protein